MLTVQEMDYFNETLARVKYSVNFNVSIEVMDHEQLDRNYREALGICWAVSDESGKRVPTRITIDEYFVSECFAYYKDPYSVFRRDSLEHVIAHEIAHLHHWRHGKKHTELTERIFRFIEAGKPHGIQRKGA